jgi:tetratricopeptide (TPR) repeat protein
MTVHESDPPAGAAPPAGRADNPPRDRKTTMLALVCLVLATALAYANTFGCPFIFDDRIDIVENPTIRSLWPITGVFTSLAGGKLVLLTRPVANLTFALNYAYGGLNPAGYHATNLAIHLGAAALLFGLARRTLALPGTPAVFGSRPTALALAISLVWALHPLQTESVTYLTQRYESLMGCSYLLGLYAARRSADPGGRPRAWTALAVAAAFLAMGCKEVAVSLPIAVLLYDRAFLAGSFREAWRRRRGLHAGLASSWLLLGVLRAFSASRAGWAGLQLRTTPWDYARSQFGVLLHYLRLAAWPDALVLDYQWPVARSFAEILPGFLVVALFAGLTVWALVRHPRMGFLGAVFFMVLAPTSSFLPLLDLAVEHRMYLPLAPLAALAVLGGWRVLSGLPLPGPAASWTAGAALLLVAASLGAATYRRNTLYRSPVALWMDTIAKAPWSARAHYDAGLAWQERGELGEAAARYRTAIQLAPGYLNAHVNLGNILLTWGDAAGAAGHFERALQINPDCFEALNNYGTLLLRAGDRGRAVRLYARARALRPADPLVCLNLGEALLRDGQAAAALEPFRTALRAVPGHPGALRGLEAAQARLR